MFVVSPLEFLSSVNWRSPPFEVRQERLDTFPDEAGKRTLLLGGVGETGDLLEFWWDPPYSS